MGSRRESQSVGAALFVLAFVEAMVFGLWFLFVPPASEADLAQGDSQTALSILGVLTAIVAVQFVLEAERLAERAQLSRLERRNSSNLTIVQRLLCYSAALYAVATVVGVLVLVLLPGVFSVRLETGLVSVGLVGAVAVAIRLVGRPG